MTTVVAVPYYPGPGGQAPQLGQISSGHPLQFRVDVASDATIGAKGSISVRYQDSAPFKAGVTFAYDPSDFSGSYGICDRIYRIQIQSEFGPPDPNMDWTCKQVHPGATFYINVTLAHDGKPGGANWPAPKTIAAELLTPT